MNLYAISSIVFVYFCKVTINDKGVNAFDLTALVNVFNIPHMVFVIYFTPDCTFLGPKECRPILYWRAFLGYLLIMAYIVGNSLIPLTVQ